jgi:hypothetical protein
MLFRFLDTIQHVVNRFFAKAVHLFSVHQHAHANINIADVFDEIRDTGFDGLVAQAINIHSLTTNKVLHFTHYLRRATFIIGAVKGGFTFFAFQWGIAGRARWCGTQWLLRRVGVYPGLR